MNLMYANKNILIYGLNDCLVNMDIKYNKAYLQGTTVDNYIKLSFSDIEYIYKFYQYSDRFNLLNIRGIAINYCDNFILIDGIAITNEELEGLYNRINEFVEEKENYDGK